MGRVIADVPDWVIGAVIIKVYKDGSLLLDIPRTGDRRCIWLFEVGDCDATRNQIDELSEAQKDKDQA